MTPDQLIEQAKLAIRWAESVKAGTPIEIERRYIGVSVSKCEDRNWHQYGRFDLTDDYEYREKPRPRECWVTYHVRTGEVLAVNDHLPGVYSSTHNIVHMREVCE